MYVSKIVNMHTSPVYEPIMQCSIHVDSASGSSESNGNHRYIPGLDDDLVLVTLLFGILSKLA